MYSVKANPLILGVTGDTGVTTALDESSDMVSEVALLDRKVETNKQKELASGQ